MLQKFDLERDEAQRNQMLTAMWGVESKGRNTKSPAPSNGRKQTVTTQQDIMRNYGR